MVIAGGGIGGLAAALALARSGVTGLRLIERADEFSEVGAGIQLGPNVTRLLRGWGLETALAQVAAFPAWLRARDGESGALLASLELGESMRGRYGAPYATVHRADVHRLLLLALREQGGVELDLGRALAEVSQTAHGVSIGTVHGQTITADALIGADGLWSRVRQCVWGDPLPLSSGHVAYRALVPQAQLPQALRSQEVTVWLAPGLHMVRYPVRGGASLNLVAVVEGYPPGELQDWDHVASQALLIQAMHRSCTELIDTVHAVDNWRLWALCDRPPVADAGEMARERVALLGDAAHPMRPYFAQGAGMALEDAHALAQAFGALGPKAQVTQCLAHYARQRWERCARVQARSTRNGRIFHASGPLRWARDATLRAGGAQLLDQPWLYGGGPQN